MLWEFFNQGDGEKAHNVPVSMFMDRLETNIAKCQLGSSPPPVHDHGPGHLYYLSSVDSRPRSEIDGSSTFGSAAIEARSARICVRWHAASARRYGFVMLL